MAASLGRGASRRRRSWSCAPRGKGPRQPHSPVLACASKKIQPLAAARKYNGGMTADTPTNDPAARPAAQPLTPEEDAAWRALARAILVVPRLLEAELLEAHGLT